VTRLLLPRRHLHSAENQASKPPQPLIDGR
jgi:hypothetical protein